VDPENVVQQSIDRLIVGLLDRWIVDQSINRSINQSIFILLRFARTMTIVVQVHRDSVSRHYQPP